MVESDQEDGSAAVRRQYRPEAVPSGQCRLEAVPTGQCRLEAVPSGQCRLEAVPSGQCRGTPPASGNPTAGFHRGARALSTRTQHLVPQGRCGDLQRCPFLLVTPSAANHFILCPRRCRASPFVGFVVERIAEPRLSSEMVARHPELAQAPMRPLFVVYRRCLVAH